MITVTSRHDADLGLPNGQTVPRRASIPVAPALWAAMKRNERVAGWLDAGAIVEEPAPAPVRTVRPRRRRA